MTPKRTHEHKNGAGNPNLMRDLAETGARMYHPPLNPDQQRAAGQLAFNETDECLWGSSAPFPPGPVAPIKGDEAEPSDLAENGDF